MARDFSQLDAAFGNYKSKATAASDAKDDLDSKKAATIAAQESEGAAQVTADRAEQERLAARDEVAALMA